MKKYLATLVLVLGLAAPAGAMIMPPESGSGLFGEYHSYSLTFRGNGDTAVYGKFTLTNTNETPLTSYQFTIPKGTVKDLSVYQQTVPSSCYYTYGANDTSVCKDGPQEPVTKKAVVASTGNTYTVTLPMPVDPNVSTVVALSYIGSGYTTKTLGKRSFEFPTLQVKNRIQDAVVAINVDADQYLAGKTSSVSYGDASISSIAPTSGSTAALERSIAQIGGYGAITKTGRDIAAGDSLTVKGSYASSWWALHFNTFVILLIILIIIGGLLYFATRRKINFKIKMPLKNDVILIGVTSLISALIVAGLAYGWGWIMERGFQSISYSFAFGQLGSLLLLLLNVLFIFGPVILIKESKGWKVGLITFAAQCGWLVAILVVYSILVNTGSSMPPWGPMPMGDSRETVQTSEAIKAL